MQSNNEEKKCDICRGRDIQGGCPKCLKYNNLRNNTFIDACQPQNEAKVEKSEIVSLNNKGERFGHDVLDEIRKWDTNKRNWLIEQLQSSNNGTTK